MTESISERLKMIRHLLSAEKSSTQEEIREELERKGFDVNQSTISRDLRRLGAIKVIDHKGRTVYKLSEGSAERSLMSGAVADLVLSIEHNENMIVISTTPGSASLVARHLDISKPKGILGTIAGDDTIFVVPQKVKSIDQTLLAIKESLS